jgi:hypothetical protein
MRPEDMTHEELLRLPLVRNDLTELERTALDRLQAALDEIDVLTLTLSEVQPELNLGNNP